MTPSEIDRLEELRQKRAEDEQDRIARAVEEAELAALEEAAEAEAAIERDRRQEAARQAEQARLRAIDEPHPSGARLRMAFTDRGRVDTLRPWKATCSHGVEIARGATKSNCIGELIAALDRDPALAAALAAEAPETETESEAEHAA